MSQKRPHLISSLIVAMVLLFALADWPYAYYQLLRWATCGVSVYVAYIAYIWQKKWIVWIFTFIAILFNPLVPIHLKRELWSVIDLVCALLFITTAILIKK